MSYIHKKKPHRTIFNFFLAKSELNIAGSVVIELCDKDLIQEKLQRFGQATAAPLKTRVLTPRPSPLFVTSKANRVLSTLNNLVQLIVIRQEN